MKLRDVVKLIRGRRSTIVRLEVLPITGEQKILKIVREKIELTDSEAQGKIFEAGKRADGSPYKVGVIDLPSFYMDMAGYRRGMPDFRSTTRDVRAILDDFNKKGVDAVVLDLRRNGGGSLTEAINLTGLFIPDGPVVQVKDAEGNIQPFNDLDPSMVWTGPLDRAHEQIQRIGQRNSCWCNPGLRPRADCRRSFHPRQRHRAKSARSGPGTLFQLTPNSPSMGALKITMQQFYRPNGESTQKRGVLADIELPSLTSHLDVGEADLDYPVGIRPSRSYDLQTVRFRHCADPRPTQTSIRPARASYRKIPKGTAKN